MTNVGGVANISVQIKIFVGHVTLSSQVAVKLSTYITDLWGVYH